MMTWCFLLPTTLIVVAATTISIVSAAGDGDDARSHLRAYGYLDESSSRSNSGNFPLYFFSLPQGPLPLPPAPPQLPFIGFLPPPPPPLRPVNNNDQINYQLALLRYQLYFKLHRTAQLDVYTRQAMAQKRCGQPDLVDGSIPDAVVKLWRKRVLGWRVLSYPPTLSQLAVRSALEEAFGLWTNAAPFKFQEVNDPSLADITVVFEPMDRDTVITRTDLAPSARIRLDISTPWIYQKAGTVAPSQTTVVDIFPILLHSIGHVLGLTHTNDHRSTLYPLFRTAASVRELTRQPVDIPYVDKWAVYRLYSSIRSTLQPTAPLPSEGGSVTKTNKCPKTLESITFVNDDESVLFLGDRVWRVRGRTIDGRPQLISQLFPNGPPYVNASVTDGRRVVLISERTIYGYDFDGRAFRTAPNYPKQLHGRVLFFPQAAFPLSNGSVVLLSGDVFATYSLDSNRPSMLEDKTKYFPNLPDALLSAYPVARGDAASPLYYAFDPSSVYQYDMRRGAVQSRQAFSDFFQCT